MQVDDWSYPQKRSTIPRMIENSNDVMDWHVYADATCAGLSALIPIPFVDLVFEFIFRKRMPGVISKVRGIELDPAAKTELGRSQSDLLSTKGCLMLPVKLAVVILKRIWRKLIYIFTVADAVNQLSDYWHRAYLLDHVIRSGHTAPGVDIDRTVEVFDRVLEEADTSGLLGLARQVVVGAKHVPMLLRQARRGNAERVTQEQETILNSHWDTMEKSLRKVALAYNEAYLVDVGEGL